MVSPFDQGGAQEGVLQGSPQAPAQVRDHLEGVSEPRLQPLKDDDDVKHFLTLFERDISRNIV